MIERYLINLYYEIFSCQCKRMSVNNLWNFFRFSMRFFLDFQCNSSIQFFNAILQYNSSIQFFNAILQCNSSIQFFNTILQCNSSIQFFNVILQYNSSMQFFNTIQFSSSMRFLIYIVIISCHKQ